MVVQIRLCYFIKIWYKCSTGLTCQAAIVTFQIDYPLGGSSKKGSHVYFLLIVAMVLLLRHNIVQL